ncbi:MAG: glycosyltransferase [Candidatus Reddybacter sp.]
MDASIIVCSYNRADSLSETITALRHQQVDPSISWEVVIVDNNSNDHTQEVVENARREWPELHYTRETQQGLSHARNHGIHYARGDILLFTDDDVLPEADWLQTTLIGMNQYQADACGGYIAPIWETPPPAWLTERFYGFLAVRTERTDNYQINDPAHAPFGANMAVKRDVFEQVGDFDTTRGRKGTSLASGEDGELFERILASGLKAVFLGRSRVHHKVESFRLTKSYIRNWRFQSSRNIAQSVEMAGKRRILNIPLYVFPQLLRASVRMVWGKIAKPKDEAFHREIIFFHFLGMIQGLFRSRQPR